MSIQFAYREGNPFMDMAFQYARNNLDGVRSVHNQEEIDHNAIVVTDRTFAHSPNLPNAERSLNAYNFLRRIKDGIYADIADQIVSNGGEAFYLRARINDHSGDPHALLSDVLEKTSWTRIRGRLNYLDETRCDYDLGVCLDNDISSDRSVKDFTPQNAIIGIDHHVVTYAQGLGSLRFIERRVVLVCPCCVHQDVTGESGEGYGPKDGKLYIDRFSGYDLFKPKFDTDSLTPVLEELVEALRQRQS